MLFSSFALHLSAIYLTFLSWSVTSVRGASNLTPPGVSAINWVDSAVHVRVYFQRTDGFVYEAQYDSNAGGFHTVTSLFPAKIGTSLAAVVINQSPLQIRVFYQDPNYAIQEQVFDGSTWTQGDGLPSDDASPITSLGAAAWNVSGTTGIRVYYQKLDTTLGEIIFDNTWSIGQNFSNLGFPGSGIGVALLSNSSLPASPVFRVYYQGRDLSLHQLEFDGVNWSDEGLSESVAITPGPGAGISVVNWADSGNTESEIRVHYEEENGRIAQANYLHPSGGWVTPSIISNVVAGFRTPITSTVWGGASDLHIGVYLQSSTQNPLSLIAFDFNTGFTSGTLTF